MAYTDQRFEPDDCSDLGTQPRRTTLLIRQVPENQAPGENAAALYDGDFFGAQSQSATTNLSARLAPVAAATSEKRGATDIAARLWTPGQTGAEQLAGASVDLSARFAARGDATYARTSAATEEARFGAWAAVSYDRTSLADAVAAWNPRGSVEAARTSLAAVESRLWPQGSATAEKASVTDLSGYLRARGETTAYQVGGAVVVDIAGILALRGQTTAEQVIAQAEPELIGGGGRYVEDDDDRRVERDDAEVMELASLFLTWRKAA